MGQNINNNFGITLTTDKKIYSPNMSILISLKVFNYGDNEITLHFNTSQRYDFVIIDNNDKEVWRWSNGRMFAQMLGKEVIGPKKKELEYQEKFIGNLKEGKYIIKGIMTTANGPFEAKIPIKVEG